MGAQELEDLGRVVARVAAEQVGHGRADRAEPHHDDVEVLGHHDARAKI